MSSAGADRCNDGYLFRRWVVNGGNEMADFVAHRLGSNAGRGSLEIDVTGATNTSVEGVAPRQEVRHFTRAGMRKKGKGGEEKADLRLFICMGTVVVVDIS